MRHRLNAYKAAPDAMKAMADFERAVKAGGLETPLLELVRMRVSMMNGCAYCIDMHSQDARRAGETEQRLYALSAWRETPFFTDRERAALEWTEAITNIRDGHAPDDVFLRTREEFSEEELVKLTLAIVAINGWNRFAIAFRSVPGSYKAPTG